MTDAELLKLILVSVEEGYCELVNRYKGYVNAVVTYILGDCGTEEEAEECISDAFVKFIKNAGYIDVKRGTFRSNLGATAGNCAAELYRKLTGITVFPPDELIYSDEGDITENMYPEVSEEKTERILNSGLEKLRNVSSEAAECKNDDSPEVKTDRKDMLSDIIPYENNIRKSEAHEGENDQPDLITDGKNIVSDYEKNDADPENIIKTARRKTGFVPVIAVAVLAAACVISLFSINRKTDKGTLNKLQKNVSEDINGELSDESIPGLEMVCSFPDMDSIGSLAAYDGKVMVRGQYLQKGYGSLESYDIVNEETGISRVLSGLPEDMYFDGIVPGITDFCLSDDGKYLFAVRYDAVIKYDVSSGKILNTVNNISEDHLIKIFLSRSGSDLYLISSSGALYRTDNQLQMKGYDRLVIPESEQVTGSDSVKEYTVVDAVTDTNGYFYLLLNYYSKSAFDTGYYGITSDSEMIIKLDGSYNVQYTIPGSDLAEIDDYGRSLAVLSDGRTAMISYHPYEESAVISLKAGILSGDSPEIEEIYELPDCDLECDIFFDTDVCDFAVVTDGEMQFWNIGDTSPAQTYREPSGNNMMFRYMYDKCIIHNNIFYYIAQAPKGYCASLDAEGNITERFGYQLPFSDYPDWLSNISRRGEFYYPETVIISDDSGNSKIGFIKVSGGKTELISEYNCSNVHDNDLSIFLNVDENTLTRTYDVNSNSRILEVHGPDGRKLCDIESPKNMKKLIASRSTDSGEMICYIGYDNKAYCIDTGTKTENELTALNDNIVFYDECNDSITEDPENGVWLDLNNFFRSERYDICMISGKKFFGYNIDTDELEVIADDLDSYGCLFTGFTVTEDGTVYCTVYNSNKLYRMIR